MSDVCYLVSRVLPGLDMDDEFQSCSDLDDSFDPFVPGFDDDPDVILDTFEAFMFNRRA
jgi:hypothetical protein